jgi:hypothetical protein
VNRFARTGGTGSQLQIDENRRVAGKATATRIDFFDAGFLFFCPVAVCWRRLTIAARKIDPQIPSVEAVCECRH